MANEFETKVAEVKAKYPDLTQYGFGGKGEIRMEAVNLCAEWLLEHDGLDRRKTINAVWTSYGIKHVVERVKGQYVANGELICAALALGYKMRKARHTSGGVAFFNIKNPTLEELTCHT
tara:strand:+ start:27866 stop:28222 length:357 start_codon:yes stop_codon:yes gene_type:complete